MDGSGLKMGRLLVAGEVGVAALALFKGRLL